MDARSIRTVFQPIVRLHSGAPFAYEALSRGAEEGGPISPRALFLSAVQKGRLVELDLTCIDLAFGRAAEHGLLRRPAPALFVNVLPDTLVSPDFLRWMEDAVVRHGAAPEALILEVNEGWRIRNYDALRPVLRELRNLGIGLAMDDAGNGHSGLHTLVELRPEFVKIDQALVRGANSDPARAAILETLVILADRLSARLVAEGIETPGELGVVRRLGIDYAQGYLIGRPEPAPALADGWPEHYERSGSGAGARTRSWSTAGPIGGLAREAPSVPGRTSVRDVAHLFENDPTHGSVVVVDEGRLVGLVTRERLYHALAHRYGHALYMRSPIGALADGDATIADFGEPVESVARIAMGRDDAVIYDDVIVTLDGEVYGTVKVRQMLSALSSKQVELARYANPLTGLPGNPVIERETRRRLSLGADFALLHVDLDNFKAFNDQYGFRHGDSAIRMTASLLEDVAEEVAEADSVFVGHIGGDDFALILDLPNLGPVGKRVTERFDEEVRALHTAGDLDRGYFVARSRTGEPVRYPLLSVTVAAAVSLSDQPRHYLDLTEAVAETKQYAKQRAGPGSVFMIDRRHGSSVPVAPRPGPRRAPPDA